MIHNIKGNTLNTVDPILSFRDFITSQKSPIGHSHTLIANEYIPVAESLLESTFIQLNEAQKCILEFIKENKLNPEKWILLNEDDYYQRVQDWFSENFFNPTEKIISGAIEWVKIYGSNLTNAVSAVVSKFMESVKNIWETVKIDTNSWYLGNKSLKRQVTMSINQQFGAVGESLNENSEDFISELTKESSQLNNMFVESVKNIVEGESFASKVTMSINKMLNESNSYNYSFNSSLNGTISELLPNAIKEGVLNVEQFPIASKKGNIKRFDEHNSVNEAFEFIDNFFNWCVSKLEVLPPFSWLKEWMNELEIKNNLNQTLEGASAFLTKYFGIPGPYQFEKLDPIYSVIITGLIDFGKYQLVNKVLTAILPFIPIVGPILSFMLTIYGFFILAQIIFELIESFNGGGDETSTEPQPTN